jgi:hypothetical protein
VPEGLAGLAGRAPDQLELKPDQPELKPNGWPMPWVWITFQLRVAEDRPEWFPKGKFATIQVIEQWLYEESMRTA